MRAILPTNLILLVLSLSYYFLQVAKVLIMQLSPASCYFLSLLGPNILLSILSSDTPNLCSSLSAREHVLHT